MARLIPISGKKMCKLVEKLGFQKIHRVGAHIRYIYLDGRKTTVSVHGNEEIGIGLMKEILSQIELSRQEYEKLRRKV